MNTLTNNDFTQGRDGIIQQMLQTSRIRQVTFGAEMFMVRLHDGRVIETPYYWFPHLAEATAEARESYVLHGKSTIILWEALNEAISIEMLLLGIPDQTTSARAWRARHGFAFMDEEIVAQAA